MQWWADIWRDAGVILSDSDLVMSRPRWTTASSMPMGDFMHHRRMSLAAVAGCFASCLAQAADLPPAPAYRPPPPLPTWTGCYVGVNAGGAWARASIDDPIAGGTLGTVASAGLTGGGQVGCDYQAGPMVFGFQGIADAMSITASGLQPNGLVMNNLRVGWIEALTARVGVSVGPTLLLYGKGGGAWMQDTLSMTVFGITAVTGQTTLTGWTAGGGLEWMFAPNWSTFVEYNYYSFSNNQTTLILSGAAIPITFNTDFKAQTVLIGINFRFGDPLVPNY